MAQPKIIFWEVDAQADFMLPGGKLYVPGAEKIIPNIERLVRGAMDAGCFLVSSGDAHPEGDPEFKVSAALPAGNARRADYSRRTGRNSRTIPNDPSQPLPQDILRSPQVVIEKQTLDVFDNPHTSELVDRLGVGRGIRRLWRGHRILRPVCGEGLARARPQSLRRERRDRNARCRKQGARRSRNCRLLARGLITTDEALAKLA